MSAFTVLTFTTRRAANTSHDTRPPARVAASPLHPARTASHARRAETADGRAAQVVPLARTVGRAGRAAHDRRNLVRGCGDLGRWASGAWSRAVRWGAVGSTSHRTAWFGCSAGAAAHVAQDPRVSIVDGGLPRVASHRGDAVVPDHRRRRRRVVGERSRLLHRVAVPPVLRSVSPCGEGLVAHGGALVERPRHKRLRTVANQRREWVCRGRRRCRCVGKSSASCSDHVASLRWSEEQGRRKRRSCYAKLFRRG